MPIRNQRPGTGKKKGAEDESLLVLNDFLKDISILANCGKFLETLMSVHGANELILLTVESKA